MTPREKVHASALRTFGLQDLTPVEARMIDTVIDATVAEVANVVRNGGEYACGGFEADAAKFVEEAMTS